jgi:hypothetical protein
MFSESLIAQKCSDVVITCEQPDDCLIRQGRAVNRLGSTQSREEGKRINFEIRTNDVQWLSCTHHVTFFTFELLTKMGSLIPKVKDDSFLQIELCQLPTSSKLAFSIFFSGRPGTTQYGTFLESVLR